MGGTGGGGGLAVCMGGNTPDGIIAANGGAKDFSILIQTRKKMRYLQHQQLDLRDQQELDQ